MHTWSRCWISQELHKFHNDLTILPENVKTEKCNKLVFNLYDKKNCVVHILIWILN